MMWQELSLPHILLAALVGASTVVAWFFTATLSKIWGEIKTLRDVRHEDRALITKTDSRLQILEMNLENIGRSLGDLRSDTDRRLTAHKTLLQELAKREIRNDD